MKKIIAIGEALIDFIPNQSGCQIKEVADFKPIVGGAPANVCGAFTKLGGESALITQLGMDPFGDKIVDEFQSFGIGCDYIARTKEANTSLAFVALEKEGGREFSFYRKPGADMLLEADSVKEEWFENGFALHFCSVSLGNFPMKEAHKRAIEYARKNGMLISFDPNVRLPLWEKPEDLREAILEFLPYADIIKISDEEIEFITGETDFDKAKEKLFSGDVKMIVYTKGGDGAEVYTRQDMACVKQKTVKAVDTTGAGDAFIGSYLYQLCRDGVSKDTIGAVTSGKMEEYLTFSNKYCGISVTKAGAIASYPTMGEMEASF